MAETETYAAQREQTMTKKLRQLETQLPPLCGEFFRGVADNTAILTRYAYAMDFKTFFHYLSMECDREPTSFTCEDLNALTLDQLERYLEYLNLYDKEDGRPVVNKEKAKARKIASLRSLFKYFYRKQKLTNNVAALLDTPKLHQKPIVRLEADEVANLLDATETGEKMTASQLAFHKITCTRDVAMLSLFLGTGIRVSELVGLNIDDLDFSVNGFKVTRKGGNQAVLYFSDEVANALKAYLQERGSIIPLPGHEKALFLSLQKKRMSVRAVQLMVKKYASAAVPLKTITPHKLRSTYGTMLYQETGDIYLVADVLGHKDVNTTTKHYAAQADERRRQASRAVKLRED